MNRSTLQMFAAECAEELPEAQLEHPFGPNWEVFKVRGKVFMLMTEGPRHPVVILEADPVRPTLSESLQPLGAEGVMAKRGTAGYPFGRRAWVKVRHADTVEARVVGFTGTRRRPRNLALVPAGAARPRLSARLDPVLAARVGTALLGALATGQRPAHGEPCTGLETDLVVEVLAGTGRHGTLTVVRLR
ncbi:MmcQ/YjbR family DNA-binding protein [Streptomyces sp. NPDC058637]|uniref:MmcQ/YjbR family DNA-binding protein n=1 Tax=Streptomyces sp. NPDC058637 TaxID=3346569 RepID=UPI0036599779